MQDSTDNYSFPECCYGVDISSECTECHDDHHNDLVHSLSSVLPTVGLLLVVSIVIIATSCWCYHNRRRKSGEMAILTEKGELVVLKDDGRHAQRRGPLVISLSQLESRRVYS